MLIDSAFKDRRDSQAPRISTEESSSFVARNGWLLSYIALFSSLLAFFILTISMIEIETSVAKRSHQQLITQLNYKLQSLRDQAGIPWLNIDESSTKGVRLTLPKDLVKGEALFESARAQINPRYLPYLRSVLEVLEQLDLPSLKQTHQSLVNRIEIPGYQLKFLLKIEGHTDSNPMAEAARFKNNVELSAFRAYAMMEWLRLRLGWDRDYFAIAGYGSFHPITDDPKDSENRRIEIYLVPQLVKLPITDELSEVGT